MILISHKIPLITFSKNNLLKVSQAYDTGTYLGRFPIWSLKLYLLIHICNDVREYQGSVIWLSSTQRHSPAVKFA